MSEIKGKKMTKENESGLKEMRKKEEENKLKYVTEYEKRKKTDSKEGRTKIN